MTCARWYRWSLAVSGLLLALGAAPAQDAAGVNEVVRLNAKATALFAEGRYREAVPAAEAAAAAARRVLGANHLTTAVVLCNLADCYAAAEQPDQAIEVLRDVLRIRTKALKPDHPDLATTYDVLGCVHVRAGRYAEGEAALKEGLRIRYAALGRMHLDTALSLQNLGYLYLTLARYPAGEVCLREAVEIQTKLSGADDPDTATSCHNLAMLLQAMARNTEAEPLLRQALEVRTRKLRPDSPLTAATKDNLATLLLDSGDYAGAELLYQEAFAARRKSLGFRDTRTATSLAHLALLYRTMGRLPEAEQTYLQVLDVFRQVVGAEHPHTATILAALGEVQHTAGRLAEAERNYLAAHQIRLKKLGPEHPDTGATLQNLAGLYLQMDRAAEAEQLLNGALQIRLKVLGPAHPETAATYLAMGRLHQALGRYGPAEAALAQALATQSKALGPDHPQTAATLCSLGEVLAATGRQEAAAQRFAEALAVQQRCLTRNLPALPERDQDAFLTTLSGGIDMLLTAAVGLGGGGAATTAMDWLLRRKAILLETQMAEQRYYQHDRANPEVAAAWVALRTSQAELAHLFMAGPGPQALADYRARSEALASQVDASQQRLGQLSRFSRDAGRSAAATSAQVVRALPDNSALVEVAVWRPRVFVATGMQPLWREARYLALVARAGASGPAMVDLGPCQPIDAAVTTFRERIHGRGPGSKAGGPDAEGRLRSLVWDRLAPLLGTPERVYLALDGQLNTVAFGALVEPGGRYLAERFVFVQLSSGRDLLLPAGTGARPEAVIVGAPDFDAGVKGVQRDSARPAGDLGLLLEPLENARREATGVADMARQHALVPRLLLGAEATESAVKSVRRPAVLHLATHGFYRPALAWSGEATRAALEPRLAMLGQRPPVPLPVNPMHRSLLALAGAKGAAGNGQDDGLLTAAEAAALDLEGTRLVCLSACQTGLGDLRQGEGVLGLRRAFMVAGAQDQVMSLWSVPDLETCDLMLAFYGQYLAGQPAADAMAAAQRAMLAKRRAAGQSDTPYFWAAFVVGGRGR